LSTRRTSRRSFLKYVVIGGAGLALAYALGFDKIRPVGGGTTSTSTTSTTNTSATNTTESISKLLARSVQCKLYQSSTYCLGNALTPSQAGQNVGSLQPSFVCEVLRLQGGETLSQQQISDYNAFKTAVLAASPNCQFAPILNAKDYSTLDQLKATLGPLATAISFSAIFFDFLSDEQGANPSLWNQAAGDYIHSLGLLYTGHIWNSNEIPQNLDFLCTDDVVSSNPDGSPSSFVLRTSVLQGMQSARPDLEIMVQANNNPQNGAVSSNLCYEYVTQWTDAEREQYLTTRATEQASNSPPFQFAYPVYFPEYPVGVAVITSSAVLSTISSLMDQYN
jgi:hypothetical protein